MRDLTTHVDLALANAGGHGFILNARDNVKMLHKAGCEAIGVSGVSKYRKIFFDTYAEATEWLNSEYGQSGWSHCGMCGGR